MTLRLSRLSLIVLEFLLYIYQLICDIIIAKYSYNGTKEIKKIITYKEKLQYNCTFFKCKCTRVLRTSLLLKILSLFSELNLLKQISGGPIACYNGIFLKLNSFFTFKFKLIHYLFNLKRTCTLSLIYKVFFLNYVLLET